MKGIGISGSADIICHVIYIRQEIVCEAIGKNHLISNFAGDFCPRQCHLAASAAFQIRVSVSF